MVTPTSASSCGNMSDANGYNFGKTKFNCEHAIARTSNAWIDPNDE